MNLILILQCAAMAVLGQIVHLGFFAIPEHEKLTTSAGGNFSYRQFFKTESRQIILTAVVCLMLAIGYSEISPKVKFLQEFPKWTFGIFGAFGSVIGFKVAGRTKQYILNLIKERGESTDPDSVSPNLSDHK